MKIKHRIPPQAHFVSDEITPEYQAEVDRTMRRAEHREEEALRRLAAAERRLRRAERLTSSRKRANEIAICHELVELRREELLVLQRQMQSSPASVVHRGRTWHRSAVEMRTL